jgi:hypothetical protein
MMRRTHCAALGAALLLAAVAPTALRAQGAPKSEPAIPQAAPATDAAKQSANSDVVNAPDPLRGKSIIITYFETRKARPEGGGPVDTRRVPFQMTVYISTEKRAFNRLTPGRAGNSDQVRAKDSKGVEKDITGFATRDVVFDGLKMTISNAFGMPSKGGGTGKREITATFDDSYAKCTANVATTVQGEYTRRRLIKGGFEELLSATNDSFTCTIRDGNVLIGGV